MKNHFAKNTLPILVVTPKGATKLGHSRSKVELLRAKPRRLTHLAPT